MSNAPKFVFILCCVLLCLTTIHAQEVMVTVQKHADSVGFYEADSGKRIDTVAVGKAPHEFALSADARFLFVTNYGVNTYTQTEAGGHTISVIDLTTRKKISDLDLGAFHRPHGIERGKSGRLYVTADFPASLLVIDPKQRKIVRSIAIDQKLPHMLAITHDEKKLYTANAGSGSISVVSLTQNKVVKTIATGGIPMGFALSRDGRRLFATTREANVVAMIDTRTDELITNIEVTGSPARLHFTPQDKHLLVSLIGSGEVAVIDPQSLKVIHRFYAGQRCEGLQTDAAGKFGYVSAQADNKIVRFSLGDWKPVLEIKTDARPDPIILLKPRQK